MEEEVGKGRVGTHEGTLTCLPDEDLLWGAQGPLPHGVVHTQPDLIPPVLAQIYGQEWGSGTQRSQGVWNESSGGVELRGREEA